MRPIFIGIGGAHSGAGKTTIASLILKRLKGWGAIKYTKTTLYCSVTDDIRVLSEEGKDTRRLLDSGAEKVLWVRSPASELEEILSMAVDRLYDLKGILVEGNSAIEILKPDIVVFISGETDRFKRSAEKILRMADVVIFDKEPPQEIPKSAKRFRRDDVEGFVKFVTGLVKE
jgi:molybdopterin-guanine dinucleotide biosynthesis protein